MGCNTFIKLNVAGFTMLLLPHRPQVFLQPRRNHRQLPPHHATIAYLVFMKET